MSDLPPSTLLVVLAEVAANMTEVVTVNAIQIFNNNNDDDTVTINNNNTHTSNGTMEDEWDANYYIQTRLGPKRLPYHILLPVTVLYCVIALGGLVGNALTCLVVAKNTSMRTSTNYYLVNLAVADLLTLILALPLEMHQMWVQYPWTWGEAACRVRAMVPETLAHVSVLTILAVSGERYVAITNPMYAHTTHTLARTTRVIPVIWLVSLAAAAPWGYFQQTNFSGQQVNQLIDPQGMVLPESAWCAIPFITHNTGFSWLMWMSSVGAFFLPMIVLITLYCKIGMVLALDPPARTPTAGDGAMHTRKMCIRMLVAVVVAFFLCWAPFHAQRLMFVIVTSNNSWTDKLLSVNTKLFVFTGTCYYLNSAVNPILYSVMSVRFRNALRRSVCGGRDWARRNHHYNSNTAVRTREFSNSSTRRLQITNRSGVGIHYGFEKMDMEVLWTVDGAGTLHAVGGDRSGGIGAQRHSNQTCL
ncbi:hypothetical protein Pmani_023446 [Petrolisthes manimaculis]|uniref:G-protein coupled receptors family 1 profile domain-containing protein n=1 Tax=Petrolisthes manimaculis TaxID=1843537 RepID=A0AAE1U118_9EUCA|nr:hypothetical protein Pmani_023446 [Petrolisthes manimaculis]